MVYGVWVKVKSSLSNTMSWILSAVLMPMAFGQLVDPVVMLPANTRPAKIETAALTKFDLLLGTRKLLIEEALTLARDWPWLPYLAGGAQPQASGFDCSGAMYFVLRKAGLPPPTQLWRTDGMAEESRTTSRGLRRC